MRRLRSTFTLLSNDGSTPYRGHSPVNSDMFPLPQILSDAERTQHRFEQPDFASYVEELESSNRDIPNYNPPPESGDISEHQHSGRGIPRQSRDSESPLARDGDTSEYRPRGISRQSRDSELSLERDGDIPENRRGRGISRQSRDSESSLERDGDIAEHRPRVVYQPSDDDLHDVESSYSFDASSYNESDIVHTLDDDDERHDAAMESSFSFDIPSSNDSDVSLEVSGFPERNLHVGSAPMTPYPTVNPHGSVSLLLRHLVKVDVAPDRAVCIHNLPGNSMITMSRSGHKTCVYHTNGRIYQDGTTIHIMTADAKVAKLCPQKGVLFANSAHGVAYRLDASGAKSSPNEKFADLCDVLVQMGVFCDEAGDRTADACYGLLITMMHRTFPNGDDVWTLATDTVIQQDRYGNIEVTARHGPHHAVTMRVSPVAGDVSVRTPRFDAAVGCYSPCYLNARADDRKVTAGCGYLTARNGSQKAGLDRNGRVVIF